MEASMAKYHASVMATRIALDAIQIMGGYGYMKEYDVERYMRDAKLVEIGGGTSEIQKLIIARELLKG
jgi:alkylation response protein AidB-like acyl-CoA dehydrogenase